MVVKGNLLFLFCYRYCFDDFFVVYSCRLGNFSGQLFITKNYILFYAKAFGFSKKVSHFILLISRHLFMLVQKILPLANITDIQEVKGHLEVSLDTKSKPKKVCPLI